MDEKTTLKYLLEGNDDPISVTTMGITTSFPRKLLEEIDQLNPEQLILLTLMIQDHKKPFVLS